MALRESELPFDSAPGFGAILPGAVVAHHVISIGLSASTHRRVGECEVLAFEFDYKGAPEQQGLGAVYAAGLLDGVRCRSVMSTLRRAMDWAGPFGGPGQTSEEISPQV